MPFRRRRRTRRPRRSMYRKLNRRITRVARMGSQIIWLRRRAPEDTSVVPTVIGNAFLPELAGAFGATANSIIHHCHKMPLQFRCFGTDDNDLHSNSLRHRHTRINVSIDYNKIGVSAGFLVQMFRLRPAGATLLDLTNGNLSPLDEGMHYVTGNIGGQLGSQNRFLSQVFLNPKYFKVLYRRYWQHDSASSNPAHQDVLGGDGRVGVLNPVSHRQLVWSKTFTIKTKYTISNPDGDVTTLPCDRRAHMNWFIMVTFDPWVSLMPGRSADRPIIGIHELSSWIAST